MCLYNQVLVYLFVLVNLSLEFPLVLIASDTLNCSYTSCYI